MKWTSLMARTALFPLFALLVSSVSCGGGVADGPAEPSWSAPLAESETEERSAEVLELEAALEDETVVPRGAFADVRSFCAAQMEASLPRIRRIEAERGEPSEEFGTFEPLVASCEEDVSELSGVPRPAVSGPFLGITAVKLETGYALETHLLVRTREGFVAVQEPVLSDDHDDPGCPSILRDAGLEAIQWGGGPRPTLLVVSKASRALFDERGDFDGEYVQTQARACHFQGRGAELRLDCDEPVTVAEAEEKHDPPTRLELSRVAYAIDEQGAVKTSGAGAP